MRLIVSIFILGITLGNAWSGQECPSGSNCADQFQKSWEEAWKKRFERGTKPDNQGQSVPRYRLAKINQIAPVGRNEGKQNVAVEYIRKCSERFINILSTEVPPYSLDKPSIAVGVLVGDTGAACQEANLTERQTFQLPAIAKFYLFYPIQPD